MSIDGQLTAHWSNHKEQVAVHDVKTRMAKISDTIKGNLAAITTKMSNGVFEEVHEDLVAEMEAIVTILERSQTALHEHDEFIHWTPPPPGAEPPPEETGEDELPPEDGSPPGGEE